MRDLEYNVKMKSTIYVDSLTMPLPKKMWVWNEDKPNAELRTVIAYMQGHPYPYLTNVWVDKTYSSFQNAELFEKNTIVVGDLEFKKLPGKYPYYDCPTIAGWDLATIDQLTTLRKNTRRLTKHRCYWAYTSSYDTDSELNATVIFSPFKKGLQYLVDKDHLEKKHSIILVRKIK
jgi:hypothetical protein